MLSPIDLCYTSIGLLFILKIKTMINLQFNYSSEYEVQRVKNTLNKLAWFKEQGYRLSLPKGLSLDGDNLVDEKFIKISVVSEYNENDYKQVIEMVNEQWLKYSSILEKYFLETNIKSKDNYEVKLTRYGVGGSYNLPNTIIINIQAHYEVGLIKTIIHEIIHLSIQGLIEKYEVEHWQKERIVDLILDKYFPQINKMQDVPIDTKMIDGSFEKNYPNIEEVIKGL